MDFYSFEIEEIGQLLTDDRFGWVPVRLAFKDPATQTRPWITFQVAVQYQNDWTVAQVQDHALQQARSLLAAAAGILDQYSLAELQELEREHAATRIQDDLDDRETPEAPVE